MLINLCFLLLICFSHRRSLSRELRRVEGKLYFPAAGGKGLQEGEGREGFSGLSRALGVSRHPSSFLLLVAFITVSILFLLLISLSVSPH